MMLEIAARAVQVLVALGGAYLVALWFVLIVWTFRDIESRSRSVFTQVFSTLLVVLFWVPGVLLYLILRPKETLDEAFQRSLEEEYLLQDLEELPLCPGCHRYVEDDFVLCPHCHAQLREPCLSCARLVDLRWALCPYCSSVQHGRVEPSDRVEAPAARWTAPSLRRRRHLDGLSPVRPARVPEFPAPAAAASVAAAPEVGPSETVAASPSDTFSLPSLVSTVRSIVRPLDRFRARPTSEPRAAEPESSDYPANGYSPVVPPPHPLNGVSPSVEPDTPVPGVNGAHTHLPEGGPIRSNRFGTNGHDGSLSAADGPPAENVSSGEPSFEEAFAIFPSEPEPEAPTPTSPAGTWPPTDRD